MSGGDRPVVIRVENLARRFGEVRAVDGVSFEVREGEIYGLLGPNGAGKTTTLSMLSGLLTPDGGRVLFDGLDLASDPMGVKARLGVVPQDTALYPTLTATENIRFWAGLYGLSGAALEGAVKKALDQVGLAARAREPVNRFSGGMKRRLNLALGLAHGPRVVLLDEPTVGIDPQARLNILEVVRGVAESGTTVLYTTHYLEEAETLCDRIGIMDHGKILAEGTLDELKKMVGGEELVTIRGKFDPEKIRERLERIEGLHLITAAQGHLVMTASGGGRAAVEILSTVFGGGLDVDGVSIEPPSLNSLFIKLTGRELRD